MNKGQEASTILQGWLQGMVGRGGCKGWLGGVVGGMVERDGCKGWLGGAVGGMVGRGGWWDG